jgi:hypothetical protein
MPRERFMCGQGLITGKAALLHLDRIVEGLESERYDSTSRGTSRGSGRKE